MPTELSDLFTLIRNSRRPTVPDLERVTLLNTLRAAGLRKLCVGPVPTCSGYPRTTIAACDEQVVSL